MAEDLDSSAISSLSFEENNTVDVDDSTRDQTAVLDE